MTEPADPIQRTLEIEDPTNVFLIHPIANRLVPLFARWRIRPNAVSLAGLAFGVLAGVAYHGYRHAGLALLGFVLMLAWHVMDGVDGQLARLTRSHSEFGKVLDGICDYTTFGAVYIGLASALSAQHGGWVWALVAVSGACHAVQSAIFETQRQDYNYWGSGQASAAFSEPAARLHDRAGLPLHRRAADLLLQGYLHIQHLAMGADADARRKLAMLLTLQPGRAARVRRTYREVFAPALRRWSVMSANIRTLAIFVFAILQAPIWFFWFEIFGLSALLAALIGWQRTRYKLLFTLLETAD